MTGGLPAQRERISRVLAELGLYPTRDRVHLFVVIESSGAALADLHAIRKRTSSIPVIFVAAFGSEQLAVESFRAGADDYLAWPVTPAMMVESLGRVCVEAKRADESPVLLGDSAAMVSLRAIISRIASTPCSVLISGETGTGKDMVARLLHDSSDRGGEPFVSINCSALPETLFESELFGFERGTFTGAHSASIGRLQAADGGTVFLDEVGELSLATQPKLLRAIDQREVQRLGSHRHETIDVRWLSATNRDLQRSVRSGLFRADLFYRLNVYSLTIPPLRERPEDIVVLARAFLNEMAAAYGHQDAHWTDDALGRLIAYAWPGNARELRNVVECSLLNADSDSIGPEHLPGVMRGSDVSMGDRTIIERVRVIEALRASHGNKSAAAQRLHCSRMTLYRKLRRHRIDVTSACDTVTSKPSLV